MNKSYLEKLLEGVEVAWKTLGEVCEIKTGRGVTKKDSSESGEYPIISGGKEPMGYINYFNRNENTVTVSRVGANAGFVSFITRKFYLNDKCFSVLQKDSFEKKIANKYMYYFLKSIEKNIIELQSEGGVPTINTTKVSNITIPIPPLSVQKEIVRILDTFTELTAELTAELSARKQQYEYYREELLSFEEGEVEWKTLGEVGELVRGNGLPKADFTETGVPAIHYGQIYTYYGTYTEKTISFVSEETAKKLRKVDTGDVIITNTSENVEDVGKAVVYLGMEQAVTGGHATIFKPSKRITGKYFAYFTQTGMFASQKRRYAKGAKVIDVSAKDMSKLLIPVPPLEEQARIVSILDKFDTLTNSISEGLPKEIELRQKQYEYYRDLLLTFPKQEHQ